MGQPEWGTHGAVLLLLRHSSLCRATYSAAVDCSVSINIAKQFMDVPDCFFLCNKELFSQHIVTIITARLHLEVSSVGTFANLYIE